MFIVRLCIFEASKREQDNKNVKRDSGSTDKKSKKQNETFPDHL